MGLSDAMGGLLTAPLTSVTTCLGSLCGPCLATACCKFAGSGSVSGAYAARCTLLWLQALTALLAVILSSTNASWLPAACGKMDTFVADGLGICACDKLENRTSCMSDQLLYRVQASGFAVFLLLFLLSVSGCAQGASKSFTVAKFMGVVFLPFVFLFLPNDTFNAFGLFATVLAALFLVGQAVLLIDFGYSWNELWFSYARDAFSRQLNQRRQQMWLGAIIVASALLFVGSMATCVHVYQHAEGKAGLVVGAMVLAFILLLLSITTWCEHGAMLTSLVVMSYAMMIAYEAVSLQPDGPDFPAWVGLGVCAISLISFARGYGSSESSGGLAAAEVASAAAEAGEGAAEDSTPVDPKEFALQCGTHALAALYITAVMAPEVGDLTSGVHMAAVYISLALYGWTLIAPKVCTNRSFY